MKLFLIDGHALIFKMYYAFLGRPMVNSKGVDTSILFGFTKYLLELVVREKPEYLAVSFDPPGGTFRNKLYPQYKANRGETPQLVIDALEPLTGICEAMRIPVLMVPGYEADDVIGAVAVREAAAGTDVYMVTPDKDYGQLVGGRIWQYRPAKGGENEVLGAKEVCDKWGISEPRQVIDILTLCGDSSDNVPGVNGIGPVGAAKLLARYGSVEEIYSHLDELTAKQRESFEAASDHIALSKELVTIRTDIELPVTLEQMRLDTSLSPEMSALLDLYEMNSLRRHFGAAPRSEEPAAPAGRLTFTRETELLPDEGGYAVVLSDDGEDKVFLAGRGFAAALPLGQCLEALTDPTVPKYGYGLKASVNRLQRRGITLRGRLLDVELMHYLLDPEKSHSLASLARTYLGVDIEDKEEQGRDMSLFGESADAEEKPRDRSEEAVALRLLGDRLYSELASRDQARLYDEIEEPLIRVLSRMELAGVKIDLSSLREFADGLRSRMLALEAEVREIAGEPALNLSSPKQIGEVLFEKLRLDPRARKPAKGNWPTDETTLAELSDRSPIIDKILDYRGTRKLLSTYIDPFPEYVSPVDHRVHTTFNQALTATGRLSSSNPNLQNIPIRTEEGRRIRGAFVPESAESVIMSADYSQIELRVMAHLCGDEHMTQAFREGVDVHSVTASKIFSRPLEQITSEERRIAKTANFGIMYGISTFGLAQRLGCSRSEAKQIIDDYFSSFPAIREFIDSNLARARENGYVETLFGRRRYLPDLFSRNAQIRAYAERNAVNAPIQGTAADIIKLAMIAVDRQLGEGNDRARMVLQIHDELVLEVPRGEVDRVRKMLVREMEGVVKLNVPLTVECNYGETWLEAH